MNEILKFCKKKLCWGFCLSFLLVGTLFIKPYLAPYYNFYFTRYDYTYPKEGEAFIVGVEPHELGVLPPFILSILRIAFPDRNIVIDNEKKPHLIVRSEHIKTKVVFSKAYQKWNAPYITFSGEYWTIRKKRYRRNGPPLAEIVSTTPSNKRQLYFPFMAWGGLLPVRLHTNSSQRKFLAYIASNCVKKRDQFFALIKARCKDAEALGVCSNPNNMRTAGNWGDLDAVYAQYQFGFAMENHQVPGYITEKIINVFRGGAIPIYWGDSKTVASYFNPDAFIDVSKFKTFEAAADFIVKLSQDPERMRAIQQAPLFSAGERSPIFSINTDPNNVLLRDAARFVREEFFKLLAKNKELS